MEEGQNSLDSPGIMEDSPLSFGGHKERLQSLSFNKWAKC